LLGLWFAQDEFNQQLNRQFTDFVEKTNAEIAESLSLHRAISTHIMAVKPVANDFHSDTQNYLNEMSKNTKDVAFFILTNTKNNQQNTLELHTHQDLLALQITTSSRMNQLDHTLIEKLTRLNQHNSAMTFILPEEGSDQHNDWVKAMHKAVTENLTSSVWLKKTDQNASTLALFSPIYDINVVEHIPAQERMKHLQFIVGSDFSIEKLLDRRLKDSIDQNLIFHFHAQISDKQHRWLTDSLLSTSLDTALAWMPNSELTQDIDIADKKITLYFSAKPSLKQLNFMPLMSLLFIAFILLVYIYIGLRQKTTQRQQQWIMENTLIDERNQAKATLNSLGEGVITTDNQGHIQFMNPKACEIFSIQWHHDLALTFMDLFPADSADEIEKISQSLQDAIGQSKLVRQHNIRNKSSQGDTILLDITFSPLLKTNNEILGATLVLEDVTHLEEMRLQIERMAKFDHLTNLYNRYEFEHQLKQVISLAHQSGQMHAFCYLDLDQFKVVNDTAGHLAGDQLLRQLSSNIFLLNLPDGAVLGRLGGDEFGLILYNTDLVEATEVCHKLIHDIRHFIFVWQGKRFQIGVSIGLVMIDQQTLSVEQCLIAADTACYLAKEKGRNRVEYANPDNLEISQRHEELSWVERIPRAIEEGKMTLFIQRMLPLNQGSRHAEVLVRMSDNDQEILLPAQFISAAERYNIMEQIDHWVVKKALSNIAHIHRFGSKDSTIFSINLSGQSLTSEKFMHFMLQQLDEHSNLMPFVCFEITETALMSNLSQAMQCMQQIKHKGASLALDDFGSGMSSFAYLRYMPIDYLKIDGAFVQNMHEDDINRAIVSNIHQLSRVFKVQTIAEYVENKEIINELRMIGVDFAQGYGIHKPEPWLV
jgi:diguanylate cyclase (GGDEF)-like protein/PAS domain S-box-containing protein